jgi:hypothetical protein
MRAAQELVAKLVGFAVVLIVIFFVAKLMFPRVIDPMLDTVQDWLDALRGANESVDV